MSHFLTVPPQDRPDLPVRERVNGLIEVRCPCGSWRPGFTLYPVVPLRGGQAWACDGCRTRWSRTAE